MGIYCPGQHIQIGIGNANANVVVVQPRSKMPTRDAITGALRNNNMLSDAYRATSNMVEGGSDAQNRYYLKELIEIIQPLIVVACGPEATSLLRQRKIRTFASHVGKTFRIPDLTNCVCYAVIDPAEYGFARASQALKTQGQDEWANLAKLYNKLKIKKEKERWTC